MAYDHIEVDINEMTLGELAEAEGYCGVSITPVISREDLPANVLMALATVVVRRTDPTFTFAQSADLKIGRFNSAVIPADASIEEVAADLAADPTELAPDPVPDTVPLAPPLMS